MSASIDRHWMAESIRLAKLGRFTASPNPIVGCVIVRAGQLLASGYHIEAGQNYAEIEALQKIDCKAKGATCYVTLEPCYHQGKTPPCVKALISSGISRCVIAMEDPNPLISGQGVSALRSAGIEVDVGLCGDLARALNPGFISAMTRQKPWLTVKLAMSLDGKTALANGSSQWITGQESRQDVQYLRGCQDAIITGRGTVSQDDPKMTVRCDSWSQKPPHGVHMPIRVVLDSQFRLSPTQQLFELPGPVWWCGGVAFKPQLNQSKITVKTYPLLNGKLSLDAVMADLYDAGCHTIMVEAGAILAGAFIDSGWVDNLVIYQAPCLLGSNARDLVKLPALETMSDQYRLVIASRQILGHDLKMVCQLKHKEEI